MTAQARVVYANPALTTCPGCVTCDAREETARRAAEGDAQLIAQARRRDGDRCRYCGAQVRVVGRGPLLGGVGRVRATAYGVMLICDACHRRRADRRHLPLPPTGSVIVAEVAAGQDDLTRGAEDDRGRSAGADPVAEPLGHEFVGLSRREMDRRAQDVEAAEHLVGVRIERGRSVVEDARRPSLVSEHKLDPVARIVGGFEREHDQLGRDDVREPALGHGAPLSGSAVAGATAQRAEASSPPQLDTDTVGVGSDPVAALVGGRAEPSAPAPADTTAVILKRHREAMAGGGAR